MPMRGYINDPKPWHDQVAEMRALAETMNDVETKRINLEYTLRPSLFPAAITTIASVTYVARCEYNA